MPNTPNRERDFTIEIDDVEHTTTNVLGCQLLASQSLVTGYYAQFIFDPTLAPFSLPVL